MGLQVLELDERQQEELHDQVVALEKGVQYPIGDDFFEIDHGAEYFAFFQRLGEVSPFVVMDENQVVGLGIGILRQLPKSPESEPQSAWYGCDLKIAPVYRRRRLPWRTFLHAFPRKYPVCGRGYGISMNPSGGRENSVVRMVQRFSLAPVSVGCQLWLYSLDSDQMRELAPTIERHRGPLGYLSLAGIKDIVLGSTGRPMPLLHLQFGPCASGDLSEPQDGHIHMFCTPSQDALALDMADHGFEPSATATLLHHRMGDWDWRFVLTSEI
jgi:hypothetical protein